MSNYSRYFRILLIVLAVLSVSAYSNNAYSDEASKPKRKATAQQTKKVSKKEKQEIKAKKVQEAKKTSKPEKKEDAVLSKKDDDVQELNVESLTQKDDEVLIQIIKYSSKKDWASAYDMISQASDKKYASTIFDLMRIYYEPQNYKVKEIDEFFRTNTWVPVEPFAAKIEDNMSYLNSPESIINWFKKVEAKSSNGKFLLLYSFVKNGEAKLADPETLKIFRHLWTTTEFDLQTEEYFINEYKDLFTLGDLLKKIELLTWDKSYTMAEKLISLLPAKQQELPKLRLEVAKHPEGISGKLSERVKKYPEEEYFQYLYAKLLLDNDHDKKASDILVKVKPKKQFDKWWKLKNIAVRNALKEQDYKRAYELTYDHNLSYGPDLAEAEWLAGWISLRFLNNANQSCAHFKMLYDKTKLASSKSKASYWLGRCHESLGDVKSANEWYETASRYRGTFYGHLALAQIKGDANSSYFEHPHKFSETWGNYAHKEKAKRLTHFAYLLHKSGLHMLVQHVFGSIGNLELDRADLETYALFFASKKYYPLTVKFSRIATNFGAPLIKEGYPTFVNIENHNLPKGIYYSIIRQESNFDQSALSEAGASGLMQLMPATAARVAKMLGISGSGFRADSKTNVALGVRYFDHLYSEYRSLPMSIAAYNAGPGNVNKWVKRYGDPRNAKSHYEVIDWIESIPFNETRNYVKSVLENFTVYDSIISQNHYPNKLVSFLEN